MVHKLLGRVHMVGNDIPMGIASFLTADLPGAELHSDQIVIVLDGAAAGGSAIAVSDGSTWVVHEPVDAGGASDDALGLDLSSGNATLTAGQYANNFLFQPDASLGADRSITAPATAKHFFATNPAGSLAFNLSIIIGATTVVVPSGVTAAFHADGTANGLVQLSDAPSEGALDIDLGSGNVTLTVTEFKDSFLFQPDANLVASRVLTAPAVAKHFMVTNPSGSGAFTLTMTIGSTTVVVAAGETRVFHADGTTNGLVAVTDDDTVAAASLINEYAVRSMVEHAHLANNWVDVTWSETNKLWISISTAGTGDNASSSADGLIWETRVSTADKTWNAVHWDEPLGLAIAIAIDTDQVAMSTTDGVAWTARTTDGSIAFRDITSDGVIFVAVGDGGVIETTTDAVTWTDQTTPNTNNFQGVCYSPDLDLFVAVANDGTIDTQIITSPDGVTWTERDGAEAAQWFDVAWSPELTLFVACGKSGTNRLMSSPDGITWTSRTQAFEGFFGEVVWSPTHLHFICWSSSEIDSVVQMYSDDGVTWKIGSGQITSAWSGADYSASQNRICVVSPGFSAVTF